MRLSAKLDISGHFWTEKGEGVSRKTGTKLMKK